MDRTLSTCSKRAVIVTLALCAALPATAQTADEIVAKYVAARGGRERLDAVQTLRMTGTMTSGPGNEARVVIEMKRPAMMRMDMTVEGTTGTQAFDGTNGWVLMPFAGITRPEPMPADVAKEAQDQADFDGPLVDYRRKGHTVQLVGRERVDGRDAYKLEVTLKNRSIRTVYLDADTCLEIKSSGTRSVGGNTVEGETMLGDYRSVNGLMLPHVMETGITGVPQKQKVVLETIEVNVPIPDDRFRMPPAGGAVDLPAASPAHPHAQLP